MKSLVTPNLLKLTLTTVILTIIFRIGLSTAITLKMMVAVILCAILYFILMWLNGFYFGKKEYEYLPINDVGFRWHLSTFIAHNVVSVLWFVFGFESKYEHINTIYITALIWLVILIGHFIYFLSLRKSSISNLHKDDLFE